MGRNVVIGSSPPTPLQSKFARRIGSRSGFRRQHCHAAVKSTRDDVLLLGADHRRKLRSIMDRKPASICKRLAAPCREEAALTTRARKPPGQLGGFFYCDPPGLDSRGFRPALSGSDGSKWSRSPLFMPDGLFHASGRAGLPTLHKKKSEAARRRLHNFPQRFQYGGPILSSTLPG